MGPHAVRRSANTRHYSWYNFNTSEVVNPVCGSRPYSFLKVVRSSESSAQVFEISKPAKQTTTFNGYQQSWMTLPLVNSVHAQGILTDRMINMTSFIHPKTFLILDVTSS